ncbi:4-alpha-glucanotransferase [Solimonas aquatica]|uniref:4-alpha-glucanotransferase n=1 Tax=Solimonas aquatica TaxID=489703 RepID=A0A1H9DJ12_9GAMM|nr:4-alpha-glucanotransferase [Solimonas aquatica]SEQ13454.1 4-alpha-glucanotransferase [Solimonas aquatica]
MSSPQLQDLAAIAGIATQWTDYRGVSRSVSDDTLRTLLEALELPCASAQQLADSHARARAEQSQSQLPPLLTASSDAELLLPAGELDEGAQLPVLCEDGQRLLLKLHRRDAAHLAADTRLPPGYHRAQLADREITLAVAPPRCHAIADIAPQSRLWGIATQLYALRAPQCTGFGDFAALRGFAQAAAARGADAVAISPVHAQFAADVNHYSPYAPSSRLLLNTLYGDPAELIGEAGLQLLLSEARLATERERLEQLTLIDWPAAARLRLQLLRTVHAQLRESLREGGRHHSEFSAFCKAGGEALLDHARFEVLHARELAQGRWHWRDWPAPLRDARSPAVARAVAGDTEELEFHLFAQWLAARSLCSAQAAALDSGMRIGLIGDLAVGTSSGGSHAWSRQHEMLSGISVGAPPDLLNALGQSWGLTAFSPRALRAHGYAPFIELLRASLRQVGGLRIDHVLGLRRLWLVPEGAQATAGAYLQYPQQDLLRLIALESARHRAVIIGEDLGTVPEGFREQLQEKALMGMRVLWFERDHGLFVEPGRWSAEAMATTTTHDLPSVAGWWYGRDVDWRVKLDLLEPGVTPEQERAVRARDRQTLWAALRYAGVAQGSDAAPESAEPAIDAALRFVARTPAPLAMAPIEDLAGLSEQPNLPGTIAEHPNWQRRLPQESEALLNGASARLALLREERPRHD